MMNIKYWGALLFFAILFTSCSRVSGRLLVIEANFFNSRGMYTRAISSYLKALEYEDAAPYAEYGLGSVYYSLEENTAALGHFAESEKLLESFPPAAHRELRSRLHYNTGIVRFDSGDFQSAAGSFRETLRIDPGRIEAKRNLELSLRSFDRENAGGERAEQQEGENEIRAALLEYVRQKERGQWISREWGDEEQISGSDY